MVSHIGIEAKPVDSFENNFTVIYTNQGAILYLDVSFREGCCLSVCDYTPFVADCRNPGCRVDALAEGTLHSIQVGCAGYKRLHICTYQVRCNPQSPAMQDIAYVLPEMKSYLLPVGIKHGSK